MTDEQIEVYRERLNTLTAKCSDEKPEKSVRKELQELAREVGASTCVLWIHPTKCLITTTEADTPELIRNIHQALQTASMINMCKTATQGYEMATKARKSASIQFSIFAAIAFLSGVAAWVAAIRN